MVLRVLLVEGSLDAQVLRPFLQRPPFTVERGGPKNGLPHEARRHIGGAYLRDRDFDSEPPSERSSPVDCDKEIHGWTWTRHEIENYLIEPALFAAILRVDAEAWSDALLDATARLSAYQAARWTIGQARRVLPPTYKLTTAPRNCSDDFKLPADLTRPAQESWLIEHTGTFMRRIVPILTEDSLRGDFEARIAAFEETVVGDISEAIVWFSGKDLIGACRSWLAEHALGSPSTVVARIRDGLIENPQLAEAHLPEWVSLRERLWQLADSI